MIGSQTIAAWIAHLTFWIVLIVGAAYGELGKKWTGVFIVYKGDVRIGRYSCFDASST